MGREGWGTVDQQLAPYLRGSDHRVSVGLLLLPTHLPPFHSELGAPQGEGALTPFYSEGKDGQGQSTPRLFWPRRAGPRPPAAAA